MIDNTVYTWDFGRIRIVDSNKITIFDTYIRDDVLCEYSYYQLPSGEIVAVDNWAEMRVSDEEWAKVLADSEMDEYFEIEEENTL